MHWVRTAAIAACLLTATGVETRAQPPAQPPVRAQAAKAPLHQLSAETRQHIARSMELAKGVVPVPAISSFYNIVRLGKLVDDALLPPGGDNFARDKAHPAVPPSKLFDNLYYIGDEHVGAFVLVTGAGIVQWDTMNNDEEAANILEAGYQKLGLNPADIKLIVLTHAHGDHYGGANYFKRKYPNIRIAASAIDWDVMDRLRSGGRGAPPPARDLVIADGQKLSFGKSTLQFFVTPGHTPGTLSTLLPVTDRGAPHLMAMVGGMAPPLRFPDMDQYAASWQRFGDIALAAGADGALSTHPGYDGTLAYITDPAAHAMRPNPWVLGRAGLTKYLAAQREATLGVRGILVESQRQ